MKINKNQFIDSDSGNSVISQLIHFDIITNEGIHLFDEHCIIHLIFWKLLEQSQEDDLFESIKKRYPNQLMGIDVIDKNCEYKINLKYEELI